MFLIKTLVFCVILTFTSGYIYVDIIAKNDKDISINGEGSDIRIISEEERQSFHINDEELKKAILKHVGGEPDRIYVKSPLPERDLYKERDSHGQPLATEIKRVFYIRDGSVTETLSESVALVTKTYNNNEEVNVTINTFLNQTVESTIESSWSDLKTKIDFKHIHYFFNIVGQRLSLDIPWGTEIQKSLPSILYSNTTIELNPGKSVQATLKAKEITTFLKLRYFAFLTGSVVGHFNEKPDKENLIAFDIVKVMRDSNLRTDFYANEVFKVVFYIEPYIEITNV